MSIKIKDNGIEINKNFYINIKPYLSSWTGTERLTIKTEAKVMYEVFKSGNENTYVESFDSLVKAEKFIEKISRPTDVVRMSDLMNKTIDTEEEEGVQKTIDWIYGILKEDPIDPSKAICTVRGLCFHQIISNDGFVRCGDTKYCIAKKEMK